MTTHRDLKKRIRNRMAQANETYSTARRHVLAQKPPAPKPPEPPPPSPPQPVVYKSSFAEWLKQPGLGDFVADATDELDSAALADALGKALNENLLHPGERYRDLHAQLLEAGLIDMEGLHYTEVRLITSDGGWVSICGLVDAWDKLRPGRKPRNTTGALVVEDAASPKDFHQDLRNLKTYLRKITEEALRDLLLYVWRNSRTSHAAQEPETAASLEDAEEDAREKAFFVYPFPDSSPETKH